MLVSVARSLIIFDVITKKKILEKICQVYPRYIKIHINKESHQNKKFEMLIYLIQLKRRYEKL